MGVSAEMFLRQALRVTVASDGNIIMSGDMLDGNDIGINTIKLEKNGSRNIVTANHIQKLNR